ncbi:hypothetical protein EYM_07540 [Ignicoccus islandicus DSM 13165]|uniref:4-vinyl reductase 4VR domain-containing protein n=1 Tax=Ignicoccus islandicus DSM 13165 TaxID=940295 RepID=A0A0U2VFL0_9CREN|nr:hypothetical protein EYM_07540 [Ignicoccus islandicus DSM 13165]
MPWLSIRDKDDEDIPVPYPFITKMGVSDLYIIVLKIDLNVYTQLIRSLLDYLYNKGVDVIHIVRGNIDAKSKSITYILLVNMKNATTNIEALKEDLRKIDGVKKVIVGSERLSDILLFPNAFPIFTFERSIIIPLTMIKAFFNAIAAYFKQPALAASTLYQLGFRIGFSLTEFLSETSGHTGEVLLRDVLDFLKAQGIGSFEYKARNLGTPKGEIIIKMTHGIETAASNLPAPRCHLTRGILSGVSSYILKSYVPMQEIKCVAKGDKYCLFATVRK